MKPHRFGRLLVLAGLLVGCTVPSSPTAAAPHDEDALVGDHTSSAPCASSGHNLGEPLQVEVDGKTVVVIQAHYSKGCRGVWLTAEAKQPLDGYEISLDRSGTCPITLARFEQLNTAGSQPGQTLTGNIMAYDSTHDVVQFDAIASGLVFKESPCLSVPAS